MKPMWHFEPTTQWRKDVRFYEKKHPNELAAVLRNLERYGKQLNIAANSRSIAAGYLHAEPLGILAIDQKGGGGNLQETRFYTYADDVEKVVYLITIGNKDSQAGDIALSKEFVGTLRQKAE
jgi:hypothetical protein